MINWTILITPSTSSNLCRELEALLQPLALVNWDTLGPINGPVVQPRQQFGQFLSYQQLSLLTMIGQHPGPTRRLKDGEWMVVVVVVVVVVLLVEDDGDRTCKSCSIPFVNYHWFCSTDCLGPELQIKILLADLSRLELVLSVQPCQSSSYKVMWVGQDGCVRNRKASCLTSSLTKYQKINTDWDIDWRQDTGGLISSVWAFDWFRSFLLASNSPAEVKTKEVESCCWLNLQKSINIGAEKIVLAFALEYDAECNLTLKTLFN